MNLTSLKRKHNQLLLLSPQSTPLALSLKCKEHDRPIYPKMRKSAWVRTKSKMYGATTILKPPMIMRIRVLRRKRSRLITPSRLLLTKMVTGSILVLVCITILLSAHSTECLLPMGLSITTDLTLLRRCRYRRSPVRPGSLILFTHGHISRHIRRVPILTTHTHGIQYGLLSIGLIFPTTLVIWAVTHLQKTRQMLPKMGRVRRRVKLPTKHFLLVTLDSM